MYKRGELWPLEVFPYEQILSFGAPLPNAYKIAVEGRELVFETNMVCTTYKFNYVTTNTSAEFTYHFTISQWLKFTPQNTHLEENAGNEMKHQF